MYMTQDLKFLLFMPKRKIFLISKYPYSNVMDTSDKLHSCNRYILVVRLWVQVSVSQGEIAVHAL